MRIRSFLLYWLPVLVWMTLIFSASGDQGSFQHSSRIIAPLMLWLFPNISGEHLHAIVVGVRKCCHLGEYAILALLFWRALRSRAANNPRSWRWSVAGLALLLAALYSASDEYHQTFVPSREGSVVDVLIDTSGAAAGLAVAFVFQWLFGGAKTKTAQQLVTRQRHQSALSHSSASSHNSHRRRPLAPKS